MRIEWLRFLEQIEQKEFESKFELGISVKWKNIKTDHEIKIFNHLVIIEVRAEKTESISSCLKMMY